ncbi:fatty-acid peroxygenase [Krasilnikovia cinnamomea]|uniref:Fatty-acid peroxygenase n=1 Tax=Krasilnikovia cinnamomea TaxID=349313 RepID=A0A4Q7ZSV3_9ACTN|nr:cytochrome P450 [Krasilnikovia cinnamomea]RZU53944.1 fatty-acid peroxygenase [Krasilnikovia cinnamomea]
MAALIDDTLRLALQGYGWLPNRRRRATGAAVHTRIMGRRAVGLCGPQAARFFYDEDHIRRHGAVPEPVRSTLFGHGAVHTLDGDAHRIRKAMFLSLVRPDDVAALLRHTAESWTETVSSWSDGRPVVLFDESSRVITRAACRWAGVPLSEADLTDVAADLVAMVDGFATLGPRHWRARAARGRLEHRLAALVGRVRAGVEPAAAGSALAVVAQHRQMDGTPLHPRLAAVELLNVVRPTVAVCWFVAFSAHALHRWPEHRAALVSGDETFADAFAHEVRRFYPFAPFVAGRAVRELSWQGERIPSDALVLLDLYGQNHDPALWPEPYRFDPYRFVRREIGPFELVPQGGGHPATGHRCPGEGSANGVLRVLATRLAALDYDVPEQDLTIALHRIPARPASGFVLTPRRSP